MTKPQQASYTKALRMREQQARMRLHVFGSDAPLGCCWCIAEKPRPHASGPTGGGDTYLGPAFGPWQWRACKLPRYREDLAFPVCYSHMAAWVETHPLDAHAAGLIFVDLVPGVGTDAWRLTYAPFWRGRTPKRKRGRKAITDHVNLDGPTLEALCDMILDAGEAAAPAWVRARRKIDVSQYELDL